MDGIKSKARVKEHGEVFTPDSIVNDMLSLIDNELREEGVTPIQYIGKTYLEPACGNGNFLIRILDRKLAAVRLLEKEKQETGLVHAVSSIYGIDIQADNVEESIERMLDIIKVGNVDILELKDKEKRPFYNGGGFNMSPETEKVVEFILRKNIVLGNALETNDSQACQLINWQFKGDTVEPLMFKIHDVEDEHNLDNGRVHWNNICKLNYKFNEDIDLDEF